MLMLIFYTKKFCLSSKIVYTFYMSDKNITPKTFSKDKFYAVADVGPAYLCAIIAPYVIAILVLLGGLAAINAGISKEQLDASVVYRLFSYLASPIGFCIMFFAFNKVRNKSLQAAKVKFKIGWWNLAICFVVPLICVFGLNFFIGGIDRALVSGGYQLSSLSLPLDHFGWYVLSIIVLALLPAIFEELIFRGIILNGLVKRLGEVGAIFMSALLFSLMHASLQQLLYTFILGIILGWIATRTGSTFSSMIVHFLNNAIVVTISFIQKQKGIVENMQPYNVWQWLFSVALVIVAAVIIFLIEKYYFKHKNKICYKEETFEPQPQDPKKGKVPILVWVGVAVSALLLVINTISSFLPPAA